jgi:Flp pilus assembly pilin Flp
MKNRLAEFKIKVRAFISDESGQSTTEYVLLLLFVVIAVKAVGGQLRTRLEGIMNAAFDKTTSAINDSGE